MRKFFLFLFSLFLGLGIFIWIYKNVSWNEILLIFKKFSLGAGLIIIALTIIAGIIKSWRWHTILKTQGYNVPTLKTFEYYLSGIAISFFMPMVFFGGEIFRGYDLKEKYSMPWPKSIASVLIDRMLDLTIYTLTAVLGVIFFLFKAVYLPKNISIIIFSGIFVFIVLIGIFYFRSFKKQSVIRFFVSKLNLKNSDGAEAAIDIEKEVFDYFRPKKNKMWQGIGLSLLSHTVLLARTVLLIYFLGKIVGLLTGISILGFSSIALTIPIPAAIGSHEAVQSFVFSSLDLGVSRAMAFVLIIRTADLIVALLGALFFFKFGVQFLQSKIINKIKGFVNKR